MKNRVLAIFVSLVVLAAPVLCAGQSATTPAANGKVGVINIQQAIVNCAEGKKVFQDLQAKYLPRQKQITQRQQEVEQLQERIQKQMTTLSEEEQRRLNRELQEKQKILRRMEEDAQSDFQNDRDDITRRIGQKMVKVIDQYAAEHGYSLVIDGSQVPVFYAGRGVDITDPIIKLFDSSNPVQQASAAGDADAGGKTPAKSAAKPKL